MSELLEIQKQLAKADQRIAQLERALVEHPGLLSVAANLDSAVRIREKLELQFAEAADAVGYELCTYRAFDENNAPKVAASFGAIALFQRLISVVYGAQKYGEKLRATVSDAVERETALGFGYAFPGSFGVVLTARNEQRMLEGFDKSDLDDAVATAFEMAKATKPKEIQDYAVKLGPGPVHALYDWANQNATNGLGAEVEWRKRRVVTNKLFVQQQQLSKLRRIIEQTSGERTEIKEFDAMLKMADEAKNRFKFQIPGMPIRRGSVEPGIIDEKHRVGLPQRYRFKVRVTTITKYSTGEERTSYHLLRLSAPKEKTK